MAKLNNFEKKPNLIENIGIINSFAKVPVNYRLHYETKKA